MNGHSADKDAPCCAHPKCPGGSLCCCPTADKDAEQSNPLGVALVLAGTIAATVILLVFGVGMFLLACVFAALVWVAVVTEQRDDARRLAKTAQGDRKAKLLAINRQLSLLAENLALKAKVERLESQLAELDQQNMALLDVVTQHRLVTDPTTQVPRLRVVADERGNVR